MTPRNGPDRDGPVRAGGRTAPEGTPVAVDVSGDRPARVTMLVFLAGPVTMITHFMLVYLVAESGCTGDGPGLSLFDPPVPSAATLVGTAVAGIVCIAFARWALRRWRERRPGTANGDDDRDELDAPDRDGSLAFAGFLLSILSLATVLLVGLPAIFLQC